MTKEDIRRATLENIVAGLLPVNQDPIRRELARRTAKGKQLTTNLTWAICWQRLQRCHPAKAFSELTPDDWWAFRRWMETDAPEGAGLAATTIYTTCAAIKASLNRIQGIEAPAMVVNPAGFNVRARGTTGIHPDVLDALDVEVPEPEKKGHVLEAEDFHRLLELASEEGRRYQTPAHVALKQALLWTFWDTGFRSDELRCLNIGEIHFEPDGGAYIQLPSKTEALRRDCRLKTKKSSRRIYVVECVGPLKAWLALHPDGTNPQAPLFLGFRISQRQRIAKLVLGNWIRDLGIKAELAKKWAIPDILGGHDFRHTRITRAVRDNWHPVKGSMYFWGIPNSKEWATYAHMQASDLRDQVRRDLGMDELGYRAPTVQPVISQAMIDEAVRRVLAEQLAPRGTQRPADHQLR